MTKQELKAWLKRASHYHTYDPAKGSFLPGSDRRQEN